MSQDNIIIFWDYASTHALNASTTISNYNLVSNIRSACLELGAIKSFRAYGNLSGQTSARISTAHSELVASGVTVINFPDDARKEAGIKTMLVDMITYAWDYPAGHTYVIISGDRDVGYAVAMLRMRRIKVVVISSVTAHPDLTAHASMKLDWTKTALGYQNGTPHFMNPLDSKPAPSEKPTISSFAQQSHTDGPFGSHVDKGPSGAQSWKSFEAIIEAEPIELRDIQPRGRRHSVFSAHDPRKFEGFKIIGDAPLTPMTQRGLFGLGDGPLFSRHGEERPRAESVPPHVFQPSNLSKSAYPSFDQKSTSVSTASSGKGKTREFSGFEPETLLPPSKGDVPYSGSISEPFGDTATSFGVMSAFPPSEHRAATITRSSSSSSSQLTNCSIVKRPDTTAPTSAKSDVANNYKPAVDEQGDMKISQTTLSHTDEPAPSSVAAEVILNGSISPLIKDDAPNPVSAAGSRKNSTSTTEAESQATEYEPIRTSEPVLNTSASIQTVQPVAGLSQPAVPKSAFHSPAPVPAHPPVVPAVSKTPASIQIVQPIAGPSKSAAPKPTPVPPPARSVPVVPSPFQPLVDVLQKAERGVLSKSTLSERLLKQNSRVYELAGITVNKKYKSYMTRALKEGIVSESDKAFTLSTKYKT